MFDSIYWTIFLYCVNCHQIFNFNSYMSLVVQQSSLVHIQFQNLHDQCWQNGTILWSICKIIDTQKIYRIFQEKVDTKDVLNWICRLLFLNADVTISLTILLQSKDFLFFSCAVKEFQNDFRQIFIKENKVWYKP